MLSFPAAWLNDGISATLDRLASVAYLRVVDALVVRTDPGIGVFGHGTVEEDANAKKNMM